MTARNIFRGGSLLTPGPQGGRLNQGFSGEPAAICSRYGKSDAWTPRAAMALTYFKRFRMEISLGGRDFSGFLPRNYRFIPWHEDLLEAHAEAKYHCFHDELDANVFSCLADYPGCLRLMAEIARKPGFLPEATWLVGHVTDAGRLTEYCGTVQGVCDRSRFGAIQNLGITADHRDQGLGTVLLFKSLEGFRRAGMRRAYLEVTAQNSRAVQLYKRLGFSRAKTLYKVVEAEPDCAFQLR